MSTANTSVSVPLMPAAEDPALPYPSLGGMTSRTRLPTVWPTSPVSQPGMTWPSPIAVAKGSLRDQEESKTFLVRQITPVYWTTMYWPFLTTGPVPLISVLTWRVFGAAVFGMVIVGPLPAVPAVTVGSAPPPLEVCAPLTPAVLSYDLSMSTTKTTVSLGPTPIDELPAAP